MEKFKVLVHMELTATIEIESENSDEATDSIGDMSPDEILKLSKVKDWKSFEFLKVTKS